MEIPINFLFFVQGPVAWKRRKERKKERKKEGKKERRENEQMGEGCHRVGLQVPAI